MSLLHTCLMLAIALSVSTVTHADSHEVGITLEPGYIFCINCDDEQPQCCENSMGLPFCCPQSLYLIQQGGAGINKALDLLGFSGIATCSSNDDCPTASGLLAGLATNEDFDCCCPLGNVCCPKGDYYQQNFQMLVASLGGIVGFLVTVALLAIAACCCCACLCGCCRSSSGSRGGVVHHVNVDGMGMHQK